MNDDCIFCQILAGRAPCYLVDETPHTRTFLDISPATPGHCLIVTRDHFRDIHEATPQAISRIGEVSTLIADAVKRELECDGVGIFQLNGAAAGQTVFHYHMHVIPRNHGEPLAIHAREMGDPAELEAMASRLSRRVEVLRGDG